MNSREKIRKYIEDNLIVFDDEAYFTDEDNIFQRGVVNSLFAMKLLTYIEDQFNITIENEELEISNFSSVNKILGFIESKISK